jgi:hypothetical protein
MNKQILNEEFKRMQQLAGIIVENDTQITLADILTKKGKLDQLKGTYLKIIKWHKFINPINPNIRIIRRSMSQYCQLT